MKRRCFVDRLKKVYARYDCFMEKQGFGIVLVVCVLVIVSSAVYTFHFREKRYTQIANEESNVQTVDAREDQTLLEAKELVSSRANQSVSLPTAAPFTFIPPVDGFLEREFNMKTPQFFSKPNYFRLHPGIDLQVNYGTAVKACADGQVLRVWQDNELGLTVRIRHSQYEAVYAGLCDVGYVKDGDLVAQGQTIGHVGNGVIAESDSQPHLHLEVWLHETAVDPVQLFLGLM